MKRIFLESHNIKNLFSGFGQFNYHLIKGLSQQDLTGLTLTLHIKRSEFLRKEFGTIFQYKKYHSIRRHAAFRSKKKYDLWHCMNQNIKVEPFYNIPYLLTIHDIHFAKEGPLEHRKKAMALFEKKLQRCNAIVYISEFAKKDTHEYFTVPNVLEYVIYNGNTMTEISLPKNFSPKIIPPSPYLFSIGGFTERKNFKVLVDMLRLLPEYSLVLAGDASTSYANSLKDKAISYGLNNKIFFTGKIEDQEKQYYLQHCEAFVFPSLREGFGIPPIEAMRFGKPVFVSNNTSLPEVCGEHAFYWDHYDAEYMAEVFKHGMTQYNANSESYREAYIKRAQSFDWNVTAKEYLDVYRELVSMT